ncbi:hypothetical protein PGT21_008040 [Puccinia graminis f. sp. tritici]|uniref:DUF3752 domain-containing protein n=1 Tax=Puccinia graminis f. sp. tritici TaxID=56615 RepID=A0A5B0RB52_PUCGR|nr:hypothetical protein PGT21_008040 [Puccinia graminis f. sp. tritici]KAA1122966.1 hypothetical protein PGTUg99_009380 [Puccinia graminis f. sp. tritici]
MSAPIAGPSSPPHLRAKPNGSVPSESKAKPSPDGSDSDSESEDAFMPSLPPKFLPTKPPKTIGPTLPPGFVISDSLNDQDDDDDEEEDERVAGPAPLPAHLASTVGLQNEGVVALKEREERQKESERIERESKLLKREEWMLLPPKELDLQATIDPTKIKARGFKQTSKPHSSSTDRQTSAGSLWTETPAERSQRLADEAIGKRRRAEETSQDDGDDLEASKRKKRDKLMRQQVEEHNKSSRNASLLDLHKTATVNISNSKTKAEKESERKQAVVWDHDAMMGVHSKLMSENQKADLIKDAKGLGGRFGGGSFL